MMQKCYTHFVVFMKFVFKSLNYNTIYARQSESIFKHKSDGALLQQSRERGREGEREREKERGRERGGERGGGREGREQAS